MHKIFNFSLGKAQGALLGITLIAHQNKAFLRRTKTGEIALIIWAVKKYYS